MNYKVKLPKELKPALRKRFMLKNITFTDGVFVIKQKCCLCEIYREDFNCEKCPFNKFSSKYFIGCREWIKKTTQLIGYKGNILNYIYLWSDCVTLYDCSKKEAQDLLRWIQKACKKYIEWVEEVK